MFCILRSAHPIPYVFDQVIFFLLIFGGIGALMMMLGIYSLVNSLVVEIGNGKVVARRSFFLFRLFG